MRCSFSMSVFAVYFEVIHEKILRFYEKNELNQQSQNKREKLGLNEYFRECIYKELD